MAQTYHYPPELFQLLVETIPLMFRSKRDVLGFFRGAGVTDSVLKDLYKQVREDRTSINKYRIVRVILSRLNEGGDKYLRERREVLRRVVEFEDFSTCWPDDQLKAQGLVSRVQRVVNVKDSFTRIQQERDAESIRARKVQRADAQGARRRREELEAIERDFNGLFALKNPQERGRRLEGVLNRLFRATGIFLEEDFRRIPDPGVGVAEQIDGVIELLGKIYLVEMKWLQKPAGVADVSQHLVRVYSRSSAGGIFISYSGYTEAAIDQCRDFLLQKEITLCTLEEFSRLFQSDLSLKDFLQAKIRKAVLDKQPFPSVL